MNKPWINKEMGHKVQKLNKQYHSKKKRKKNILSQHSQSLVRSLIVKTPFSIVSDVSNFFVQPILNASNQEVFVCNTKVNNNYHELDAKLLNTSFHYQEEPYCRLVSSKISENRVLLKLSIHENIDHIIKENEGMPSWIPIHNLLLKKETQKEFNNSITIELPVEIGKYKSEIVLQQRVMFEEKITAVKEIMQDIILTEKKLLLSQRNNKKQNRVEKGTLFVEGYIFQRIEYVVAEIECKESVYGLMQNMVLELTIQILQRQEMQF
ncbi:BC_2427 family protein [Bacillus wiedmannii]|uniref:BC_2427 family protein n=1 Tax=Bacillus wiedmannii TaxID=1890302 RepID=UPI003CE890FF